MFVSYGQHAYVTINCFVMQVETRARHLMQTFHRVAEGNFFHGGCDETSGGVFMACFDVGWWFGICGTKGMRCQS